MQQTLSKMYVAYHDPEVLAAAQVPACAEKINLNDLQLVPPVGPASIAESRLILKMALNPDVWVPKSGFLGLFHASYDRKFSGIPTLCELPAYVQDQLTPTDVVGPVMILDYMEQSDRFHMGMSQILKPILDQTGVPISGVRTCPATNSFIAHTDVWRRFLPAWLRMYHAAMPYVYADHQQYDTHHCKKGLEQAYLCERFTMAWFAAQEDLRCMTIVAPNGAYYTSNTEPRSPYYEYTGDVVTIRGVRINRCVKK